MERILATAALVLGLSACGNAAPAQAASGTCWLDAMSDAEKRALVLGYAEVRDTQGRAEANAWARGQQASYVERSVATGACPPAGSENRTDIRPSASTQEARTGEPQLLNDEGKPCKRIELENQNVPNVGGSMGWALVQVCKD